LKTRLEIKRIELFSVFKLAFFIYAIIGIFIALIYGFFLLALGGLQSAILGHDFPRLGALGIVLGIMAIPIVALMYGAVASVFITIGCWIFNLIAGAAGGLRVEAEVSEAYTEPVRSAAPEPSAPPPNPGGSITPPDGPTFTRSSSLDDE
jgi:hypothetical protein